MWQHCLRDFGDKVKLKESIFIRCQMRKLINHPIFEERLKEKELVIWNCFVKNITKDLNCEILVEHLNVLKKSFAFAFGVFFWKSSTVSVEKREVFHGDNKDNENMISRTLRSCWWVATVGFWYDFTWEKKKLIYLIFLTVFRILMECKKLYLLAYNLIKKSSFLKE